MGMGWLGGDWVEIAGGTPKVTGKGRGDPSGVFAPHFRGWTAGKQLPKRGNERMTSSFHPLAGGDGLPS